MYCISQILMQTYLTYLTVEKSQTKDTDADFNKYRAIIYNDQEEIIMRAKHKGDAIM